MMPTLSVIRFCAFFILSFYSASLAQDVSFPTDLSKLTGYTTEVQFVDVKKQISAYATEYFYGSDEFKQGSLKIHFKGLQQEIYYDQKTKQISNIMGSECTVSPLKKADFVKSSLYAVWSNAKPLIIGPSAALWFAQSRNDINKEKPEMVRDVLCDKYTLPVDDGTDNFTIEYYFPPKNWKSPYIQTLTRTPLRIRIQGFTSRGADEGEFFEVDQINDFAYFKPGTSDLSNVLPPIGIGCDGRTTTDEIPKIPEAFQFSAEVTNLLTKRGSDIYTQFEKVSFDSKKLLARKDRYSREDGAHSTLYEFKTGIKYDVKSDGSCKMSTLIGHDFEVIDYGTSRRIMTPQEVLNLEGDFYEMRQREIRGLVCDAYESVQFYKSFEGKEYYKFVVTAYFTKQITKVGINGIKNSRIPTYLLLNGWSSAKNKTLQRQYNIFEFNHVIMPEMYSTFKLERCFPGAESRAYFVLMMIVPEVFSAKLEGEDELLIQELKKAIAQFAKVPEMRIPFLKADYKAAGVFVTGLLIDRPPSLLQFKKFGRDVTVSFDKFLKEVKTAKNAEACAYACIDEKDMLCKGFYMCGRGLDTCYIKSTDEVDTNEDGKGQPLGECSQYLLGEIETTNIRQAFLEEALANLELAILDKNVTVMIPLKNGEAIVTITDIVIGDGPYTGTDSGDKDYTLSIELRKLDSGLDSTTVTHPAETLHDCYKECKKAGALCTSFSYCPDSTKENKECMYTSDLMLKGRTKDNDLIPDRNCNIYNLKFLDYFTAYPEKVSLLPGDKVVRSTESLEQCAVICRVETEFKCRGFEYCKTERVCTLHTKHILDLKPDESGSGNGRGCVHYGAQYAADFVNMGRTLIQDNDDVRFDTSLEDCAKICTEELNEKCNSFNYCPAADLSQSTCALSMKMLKDDKVPTYERSPCDHFEKRGSARDWNIEKAKIVRTEEGGYTKKGFAGLVVGMLALGLLAGALGFVLFSYFRSRSSGGEGMAVRFMKNDS